MPFVRRYGSLQLFPPRDKSNKLRQLNSEARHLENMFFFLLFAQARLLRAASAYNIRTLWQYLFGNDCHSIGASRILIVKTTDVRGPHENELLCLDVELHEVCNWS